MPANFKQREEYHKGVAKEKMTEAELACKPLTSAEYRSSKSFDFQAVRDYSKARIKQGLGDEEFTKQELMAICSTRGLKYHSNNEEILTTRLREYADENLQKGKFYSSTSYILFLLY
jgi:hypothetical protein